MIHHIFLRPVPRVADLKIPVSSYTGRACLAVDLAPLSPVAADFRPMADDEDVRARAVCQIAQTVVLGWRVL
jgi:hypothetical protein